MERNVLVWSHHPHRDLISAKIAIANAIHHAFKDAKVIVKIHVKIHAFKDVRILVREYAKMHVNTPVLDVVETAKEIAQLIALVALEHAKIHAKILVQLTVPIIACLIVVLVAKMLVWLDALVHVQEDVLVHA